LFVILAASMTAQKDKNIAIAFQFGMQGIDYENTGKYDSAIASFDSAIHYDPVAINYPYEKALVYYQKKEFATSAKMFDSLISHPQATDQVYQLLGNSLDNMGLVDSSVAVYKKGLARYPKSGRLYMELGLVEQKLKSKDLVGKTARTIISYFEKGIEVEPQYEYNYYYITTYYCKTVEKLWGFIYGEIFMNISDNKKRSPELGKLIFNATQSALFYAGDTVLNPKFTSVKKLSDNEDLSKMRFEEAFQSIMKQAAEKVMKDEKNLTIEKFIELRVKFIDLWYKKALNKKFPNVLFDWQKRLIQDKMFEAYNYSLFNAAEPENFRKWLSKNRRKMAEFGKWLRTNMFSIDEKYNFSRFQYDK